VAPAGTSEHDFTLEKASATLTGTVLDGNTGLGVRHAFVRVDGLAGASESAQTRTRLWRESNQSLLAPGIPAGKTFAEARDRGGVFGDTSRLRATETTSSRVCGWKGTEN
jgi:hypothetical protein